MCSSGSEGACAPTSSDSSDDMRKAPCCCARALEEGRAASKLGAGLVSKAGPILLVSAMMYIFIMLEVHFYMPYLYTRVRCCTGADDGLGPEYDITSPAKVQAMLTEAEVLGLTLNVTGAGGIPACGAPRFPKNTKLWSMSPHCTNKAYVQQSAQHVMGIMKPLQKAFTFVVLPLGGALADSWGRIPVLVVYAAGLVVACLLSALDAHVGASWGDGFVYVAGCLIGLSFQPKDSVLCGAVADIFGDDEVSKGRVFVMIRAMDQMIAVVIDIIVYLLLRRHSENYFGAWIGFAGFAALIGVGIALFVKETLHQPVDPGRTSTRLKVCCAHAETFRIISRDRALSVLAVVYFLLYGSLVGFWTTRTSYLTTLGFKLENTMLPEVFSAVAVVALSLGLMPSIARVGVWRMNTLGQLLFASSFVLYGPVAVFFESHAAVYVAQVFFSAAALVIFPSLQTIVSQRVEPEHQSKCQGAMTACGTLGAVSCIPLYDHVLFDAKARGMARATCANVSLVLSLLCAALSAGAALVARRGGRPADDAGLGPE